MSREVKRVALDFVWPLYKVWTGFVNPYSDCSHKCDVCDGTGYSPIAKFYYEQWWGKNDSFDPVEYGSELLTPESPAVKAFINRQLDRSETEAELQRNHGRNYYTCDGALTREEAYDREAERLLPMWNHQWSHHLIAADVEALVADDRLWDFTNRPRPGVPLEEYVRTRAYYLWLEAGSPVGDGLPFWLAAEKEHERYWLPFNNGYMPTPDEVNAWHTLTMGHDSLNCHTCVEARCERAGQVVHCPVCGGHGHVWFPVEAQKKFDEWEPVEPPAGDGYQIWESYSDGSPISPVFADPGDLAAWMASSGDSEGLSVSQWLKFILGPGWAPSGAVIGGVVMSGVEAVTA